MPPSTDKGCTECGGGGVRYVTKDTQKVPVVCVCVLKRIEALEKLLGPMHDLG